MNRRTSTRAIARMLLLLLSSTIWSGCADTPQAPPTSFETLQAIAWVQLSAERDALCLQAYQGATAAVNRAVQSQPKDGRPLAVILDIDETALDNSPYQASCFHEHREYSPETWHVWILKAACQPIPGAAEFTRFCDANGVQVIYITNRTKDEEDATRHNLSRHGFAMRDANGLDSILCRGELDETSSKSKRREYALARFEVVAFVGDDLGDFVEPAQGIQERAQQVSDNSGEWNHRWFALPNPLYGSWLRALERETETTSRAAMHRRLREN